MSDKKREYWEKFKQRLMKPEIFKEIGWLKELNPPPEGNYWKRTIRSSDVHLIVRLPRVVDELPDDKNPSLSCEIMIEKTNKGKQHHIRKWKDLFYYLFDNKDKIEQKAGLNFMWKKSWEEDPDAKSTKIIIYERFDFDDEEHWDDQFDWLIDKMLAMKRAFEDKDYLK